MKKIGLHRLIGWNAMLLISIIVLRIMTTLNFTSFAMAELF